MQSDEDKIEDFLEKLRGEDNERDQGETFSKRFIECPICHKAIKNQSSIVKAHIRYCRKKLEKVADVSLNEESNNLEITPQDDLPEDDIQPIDEKEGYSSSFNLTPLFAIGTLIAGGIIIIKIIFPMLQQSVIKPPGSPVQAPQEEQAIPSIPPEPPKSIYALKY
jgi:hypothetical protein